MRDVIRDVLLEWLDRPLPDLVKREAKFRLSSNILAIFGPRRAGKTYFMYQIVKELMEKHGFERQNIVYLDFEDVRLVGLRPENYGDLVNAIHELFRERHGKIVLMLDEIHNLKNYGKWLRTLHNSGRYYIFIAGSSSRLMAKEIASELRGRYVSQLILPFSFREYLNARKIKIDNIYYLKEGVVLNALREYMNLGGYPEVVLTGDKDLLRTYKETIFYRDIVDRYNVRDVVSLDLFMKILMDNAGKYLSISKIHNYFKSLGIKKSKKTLTKYFNYFDEAMFIIPVEIFSYSMRDRIRNPRKIYLIDLGFYSLIPRFTKDIGLKMENLVAIELLRRGEEFFYYKYNDKEIDFITKNGEIIEVTYTLDRDHISKVSITMSRLGIRITKIITWDEEDEIERYSGKIQVIPLWKWLLYKY